VVLASGLVAAQPDEPEVDAPSGVGELRRRQEAAMGAIGELEQQARDDADAARAACVADKRLQAQEAMELATSELLIVRDASSSPQARTLAAEKFGALVSNLEGLVAQARACMGQDEVDRDDQDGRTNVDDAGTVPVDAPTRPASEPSLPPAVGDTRPPAVASPAQ